MAGFANGSKNLIWQQGTSQQIQFLDMWAKENDDGGIIKAEAINGENLEAYTPGNNLFQSLSIRGKWLHKFKNEAAAQVSRKFPRNKNRKQEKNGGKLQSYREMQRRRKRKSFIDGEAQRSGDTSERAECLCVTV